MPIVISSGVTITSGVSLLGVPPPELYSFTSFTFTNAAITGQNGPTLANCLSSYNTAANTWLNNTAYFNVVTQGYQLWTVPATGSYRITSIGACGGDGNTGRGAGAQMIGVFAFTEGQKLKILVGQQGSTGTNACSGNKGGGGGGSFVVSEDNSTPYIVAAGGGGGSTVASGGTLDGGVSTTAGAGASSGGAAGTSGGGGGVQSGGCAAGGGGGGGFSTNGSTSADAGAGVSFVNGGSGGAGGVSFGGSAAAGGFGGGAGGSSYMGGGAGGYSGGGGGGLSSCSCSVIGSGGGGGSFNSGTSAANTAAFNRTTHGSVLIEKL